MSPRVIVRVEVDGCRGSDRMVLQMMYPLSRDTKGMCVSDAVWRLSLPGRPNGFVRLNKGRAALDALLEKYSFVDGGGCAYTAEPEAQTMRNAMANARTLGEMGIRLPSAPIATKRQTRWLSAPKDEVMRYVADAAEVGRCHFRHTGIAQLSEASGICWYSSLWFSLLSAPELREHLRQHVRKQRDRCPHCTYVHDHIDGVLHAQDASEGMRAYLFFQMAIGDRPGQDPSKDGQNGAVMGTLLMAKLGLPMRVVVAPEMATLDMENVDANEARVPPAPRPTKRDRALLLVRTYRTRWDAPERLEFDGRVYTLQSALVGSEFCGHQTSIARSCEKDTWAMSDSDAIARGILPFVFRKRPGDAWAPTMSRMLPVSNASSQSKFCDMAPAGRHPLKLVHDALKAQGAPSVLRHVDTSSSAHDLINVDYWYLEEQAPPRAE